RRWRGFRRRCGCCWSCGRCWFSGRWWGYRWRWCRGCRRGCGLGVVGLDHLFGDHRGFAEPHHMRLRIVNIEDCSVTVGSRVFLHHRQQLLEDAAEGLLLCFLYFCLIVGIAAFKCFLLFLDAARASIALFFTQIGADGLVLLLEELDFVVLRLERALPAGKFLLQGSGFLLAFVACDHSFLKVHESDLRRHGSGSSDGGNGLGKGGAR